MTAAAASSPPSGEPDRAVVERAAAWLALLHSPDADEADRTAAQVWRAEHPHHERAWIRLEALWSDFEPAADAPARRALDAAWTLDRRRQQRRAGAAGVLFMAGLALAWSLAVTDLTADYRTTVAQRRQVELPDHSRLVLNAHAAVDVDFSGTQRRIVLRRGEVMVEVASDAARPFIVETPQGSARALGTRYRVAHEAQARRTEVTVLESSVRVCAPAVAKGAADCADLVAGDQAVLDARGLSPVRTVDAEAAGAWTQGQLVVDDRPVTEVLKALAAYRRGQLRFDAEALAGVRVSGVFPLDDPDRALDVLARTLPLEVRRYTSLWVSVGMREP